MNVSIVKDNHVRRAISAYQYQNDHASLGAIQLAPKATLIGALSCQYHHLF